jgi:WD40 repeat protein
MTFRQNLTPRLMAVVCAASLAFPFQAMAAGPSGTSVELLRRINNPSPSQSDFFGVDIESFGEHVLIGTSRNAAHVYDVNTGAELLRVSSPEPPSARASFGEAVVQVGNMIAVSDSQIADGGYVRVGSVYLFDGAGGGHLGTIRDPNPFHFDLFGHSTESAAGRLFISDNSHSSSSLGQVRVYDPATRALLTTISNPRLGFGFGAELEEHQGDIFIAAQGGRVGSLEAGIVYRYDAASPTAPLLTIPSPQPFQYGSFGAALDADGEHLLVGAPNYGSASTGRAYLFNADTGSLLFTIPNPEPADYINFGSSVALLDDYIVVSAPGADLNPSGVGPKFVGAAYVFDRDTGGLLAKVIHPDPSQNTQFGLGGLLGIGNRFLAASYLANNSAGRVYYFAVVPEPSAAALVSSAAWLLTARRRRS